MMFTNCFLLKRITIPEIKQHPWFLKNLPKEIVEIEKTKYKEKEGDGACQSVEEIMHIIQDAGIPGKEGKTGGGGGGESDTDDLESEVDVSGDYLPNL